MTASRPAPSAARGRARSRLLRWPLLLACHLLLTGPRRGRPRHRARARRAGPLTLELTELTPRVVTADGPARHRRRHPAQHRRPAGRRPRGPAAARRDAAHRRRRARRARRRRPHRRRHPGFTPLPGALAPGRLRCRSRSPSRCAAPRPDGLALTRPGVYEVLVNVNGVPRDGGRARLAAVRLLLPVLSLPPGPDPGRRRARPRRLRPRRRPHRALPPDRRAAAAADRARRADPARRRRPRRGRSPPTAASAGWSPPSPSVRRRVPRCAPPTCLAVDPDLVATAAAMRQGYRCARPTARPRPARAPRRPGTWLDALAAAARGGCVVALPFADADLVALARGELGDLARLAVADGRHGRRRHPRHPGGRRHARGPPTACSTSRRSARSPRPAPAPSCCAPTRSTAARRTRPAGVVPLAGGGSSPLVAVLTDPLLSRAARGRGTRRPAAWTRAGAARCRQRPARPAAASPPLSTQDALAALVFRAQAAAHRGTGRSSSRRRTCGPPTPPAPAPCSTPSTCCSTPAGCGRAGSPTSCAAGSAHARWRPGAPADPLQAGARDIPPPVLESVREMRADVARPALGRGARERRGRPARRHVRPAAAGRAAPRLGGVARPPGPRAARRRGAAARIGSCATRSACSPRPARTRWAPATRRCCSPCQRAAGDDGGAAEHLQHHRAADRPDPPAADPPARPAPGAGRAPRSSGRASSSVEATVRTPAGRTLGPPSRLQVRSTAYGTITVWLTGCAGVLLVVLAARRVVRRIRGEPSRRDRVGPAAGPPQRRAPQDAGADPAPEPPSPPTHAGPTRTRRPRPDRSRRPPDRRRSGPPRPTPTPQTRPVPARRP